MQELKELGIDTSKARLYLNRNFPNEVYCLHKNDFLKIKEGKFLFHFSVGDDREEWRCDNLIPTFTLQDILEILPNFHFISINYNNYIGYTMNVCSSNQETFGEIIHTESCMGETNNMLEAAFNMLKWCKQNNYI